MKFVCEFCKVNPAVFVLRADRIDPPAAVYEVKTCRGCIDQDPDTLRADIIEAVNAILSTTN